jgi:DNA topoisomerase-3
MKKALLIAEKPSLASAIEEGYKHYPNKQFDITYCAADGHLMELYMPNEYCEEWKKWDINILPLIPKQFKNKVSKDYSLRYKNIQDNLNKGIYDVVINAGDPAREGELIIDEILKSLNCKLPELRLWTEDLTVNGICKAFDNLLQPQNNLKKAAYLRQWNDWLIGINGSRTISLATGCNISVGRIMSVITAMVVNRDKDRETFVPKQYYECAVTINKDGKTFEGKLLRNHNDIKFDSQEEIQQLMNRADVSGKIVSVTKEIQTKIAPLLLNLTALQKESFSEYGYSPDIVSKIAQSLYEKKLLSYPRTDCRYISENVALELPNSLKALAQIPEYSQYISKILVDIDAINKICKHNNAYVDNSKLTDHHALITTSKPAVFTSLSKAEQNIYKLVSRRVVAMFMPEQIISKTKVICSFGDISTISQGHETLQEGYSILIPTKIKDKLLPIIDEEDVVTIDSVEGEILETKPPAYYNFKTLLEDMEKYGIGQSSTRDKIINKVISLNYIKEVTRSSKPHLESTTSGRYIVEALKDSELISFESTAKMEKKLSAVEMGAYDANTYYFEMLDDVKHITEQLKNVPVAPDDNPLKIVNKTKRTNIVSDTDVLCPVCGKPIKESDKGFFCSGWSDKSCTYFMKKSVNGVKITLLDLKSMLSGRPISRRFTWKSGKKSQALLGIEDNKYKFYFDK